MQHTFVAPTCILRNSPLDRAGVQPGMMTAYLGGEQINGPDDLEEWLEDREPGDEAGVAVMQPHGHGLFYKKLRLGEAPE